MGNSSGTSSALYRTKKSLSISNSFEEDYQIINAEQEDAQRMIGLVRQILLTMHINNLFPEVLIRIFEFFPLHFIARSIVRVCRRWRAICYVYLKPQQLEIFGSNISTYKMAVRRYNINTVVVHNCFVDQIANILKSSKKDISTLVAYGLQNSYTKLHNEDINALAKVTTLAVSADRVSILNNFPSVTRLQLVHSTYLILDQDNSYSSVKELAVDSEFLLRNFTSILSVFPALKKLNVLNDPEMAARTLYNDLREHGIELLWPLNFTEEQLLRIPYQEYYFQTGETIALSHFSVMKETWPTIHSSLEYEMDLRSRPLEYIYPSAVDFTIQRQIQPTEKEIIRRLLPKSYQDVLFIVETELLPYWKRMDLCLQRREKESILDLLAKFVPRHISVVKPRVLRDLIEYLGITELIGIIGVQTFYLLANSGNVNGTRLVHKLVAEDCRVDLNEIEPYIESWHVENSEGIAPIDIAVKSLNLSVIIFLLQHGAPLKDTENIPFLYKNLPIFKECLSAEFLKQHITKMLFHEDWLRSGSVIKALDEMVELGANVNAYNNDYQSFLNFVISFHGRFAQKVDMVALIQRIVMHYQVDINHIDRNGDTPLGTAIKTGNTKIIKLIIRLGANVSCVCSNNMKPIPFICSSVNNINEFKCLANCLLEYGADINATSVQFSATEDREISPLLLALEKRSPMPFVQHLVDRGALLNYVDSHGRTFLHHLMKKMKDTDVYQQVIDLVRQHIATDAMEIENQNGDNWQVTPQLSQEILEQIFNAVEA